MIDFLGGLMSGLAACNAADGKAYTLSVFGKLLILLLWKGADPILSQKLGCLRRPFLQLRDERM